MADPRIRQIKIKTGVVRRVAKEGVVYAREAELQRARVQRLKDADEEEHTVRKQEEVLQEALMMVPDCRRRLVKAHADLKGILESEVDLKEHEDYITAKQVLTDAETQLAETVEDDTPYNTFQRSNPSEHQDSLAQRPINVHATFRSVISDEDFIAQWEQRLANRFERKTKKRAKSISEARQKVKNLVNLLESIKCREKYLSENLESMTQEEWHEAMILVQSERANIDMLMSEMNDSYINELQQSLSKRNAKRLRIKKLKLRKAEERKQILKARAEKHRKIDENLQKIRDDLEKIKRTEEEKIQADSILRDVFRKKHDAKKLIEKLQALIKLRRARGNTARGRGELVSEAEANCFNKNIEKLTAMWRERLARYEREESELRSKLTRSEARAPGGVAAETARALDEWCEAMFGAPAASPQRDFHGNVAAFVAVRSKWDAFLNKDGSSIPVGWVLPQETSLTWLQG